MTTIRYTRDHYHLIDKMMQWCTENVGPGGYGLMADSEWKIEVLFGYPTFYFAHSEDATAFTLVWG